MVQADDARVVRLFGEPPTRPNSFPRAKPINAPLLRKTMDYIEEHPEEWYQAKWGIRRPGCGTRACFAGHALMLSGYELLNSIGSASLLTATHPGRDKVLTIAQAAKEELGLDMYEADALFCANNTMSGLRSIVTEFIDRAEQE